MLICVFCENIMENKEFKASMCSRLYDFSQRQLTVTGRLCPKLNWTTLRNELYWRLSERQSEDWERFRFSYVKNVVFLSWKIF